MVLMNIIITTMIRMIILSWWWWYWQWYWCSNVYCWPVISLLATLFGTRIFHHNPTRTLLGVKKPYSLGPDHNWQVYRRRGIYVLEMTASIIKCIVLPFCVKNTQTLRLILGADKRTKILNIGLFKMQPKVMVVPVLHFNFWVRAYQITDSKRSKKGTLPKLVNT